MSALSKYPPAGRRGSGARLATFRWPAPEGYYDFADSNVLVVTIIEEVRAVEKIDEIAATPGVDVIFIGTGDLSFSLGLRGEQNHPDLRAAIAKIVAAAKANKKFLGRILLTPEAIKESMAQGFLFFQAAFDVNLIASGARQLLEPLGKLSAVAKPRALY
jgi:2-keto-3-deoxy-L-rhamnonate aldolase RhmA